MEKQDKNQVSVKLIFKNIFGSALEPLGFKKAIINQMYYIRMIGDDIMHIIGINDMKTHIKVFGAVATVYRETLCLDKTFKQNEEWLKSAMDFYVKWHISDKPFDPQIQSGFLYYKSIDPNSIFTAMQDALSAAITWILPVLESVQTKKDILDFTQNNGSVISLPLQESFAAPYCDTAIQYLLDDPLGDMEKRYEITMKALSEEDARFKRTPEEITESHARYEQMIDKSRKMLKLFLENEDVHRQTIEELARRKAHNTELLHKYGIL